MCKTCVLEGRISKPVVLHDKELNLLYLVSRHGASLSNFEKAKTCGTLLSKFLISQKIQSFLSLIFIFYSQLLVSWLEGAYKQTSINLEEQTNRVGFGLLILGICIKCSTDSCCEHMTGGVNLLVYVIFVKPTSNLTPCFIKHTARYLWY